jgi:hypothetical protein
MVKCSKLYPPLQEMHGHEVLCDEKRQCISRMTTPMSIIFGRQIDSISKLLRRGSNMKTAEHQNAQLKLFSLRDLQPVSDWW